MSGLKKDTSCQSLTGKRFLTQQKRSLFGFHFGAGNIFRAFQANVVQNLLNEGILSRGLIVAEGYDYEIIEK